MKGFDAARGALIGGAEAVPGMSGGTVALATGVYEVLLGSLAHLSRAVRTLAADGLRGGGVGGVRVHLSQVPWSRVLPIGFGMLAGLVAAAQLLGPVLEEHPGRARAVFFGLVLGAVVVPVRLLHGRAGRRHVALGAGGAAAAFVLTGIPPAEPLQPPLLVVALAVSVAVCALVLPGVSAAFLLLTVGLYTPTLAAVNNGDLAYIAAAAVGGLFGLGVWAVLLQRLLRRFRAATLAALAGLMVGSLRALWPWQGPDRELLAPEGDVGVRALLAAAGALAMLAVVAVRAHGEKRSAGDCRGTGRGDG